MDKISEKDIDALVEQKLNGKSYSILRAQLSEQGFSENEIRETITKVDEKVLQAEIGVKHLGKTRQWYRTGFVLAVLGIILTLSASRGIFLEGLPKWIIYSPFFAGILIMFYGRKSQRQQPGLYEKGPGRIRKKRPYK